MDAGLDELGYLGDVLEAGAGADEGADGEVEAVVVEEGECQRGRTTRGGALGGVVVLVVDGVGIRGRSGGGRRRRRGNKGHGEGAGEPHDAYGEGDGENGHAGGGPVEDERGLDAEGYDVGEVDVHAGLEAAFFCAVEGGARGAGGGEEALFGGHDAAVAEDGELVAEGDLGDFDVAQERGLTPCVEDLGQTGKHSAVLTGVCTQLGDRLGDEHVEPVEALRLVSLHVVVRFREDGADAGATGAGSFPDDIAGALWAEGVGGGVRV